MPLHTYPSINQFRHAVNAVNHRATYTGQSTGGKPVYDTSLPKPVLTFHGTTKLHGTNAGLRLELAPNGDSNLYAQCRTRDITPEDDNSGFAAWALDTPRSQLLREYLLQPAMDWVSTQSMQTPTQITLFGEWVGPTVNGKTGIGLLPNRLVLFGLGVKFSVDEESPSSWFDLHQFISFLDDLGFYAILQAASVFAITTFKEWELAIDFNNPEGALDTLERLTLEVEAACPVAEALGGSGIGEGIVWTHVSKEFGHLSFKTKGMKHKGTRTKRMVDVAPEVMASISAFADAVLTDSRLEQGLDYLEEQGLAASLDNIGEYLKWVGQDVTKEESDTLAASGLDRRVANKAVNSGAKAWFLERVDQFAV